MESGNLWSKLKICLMDLKKEQSAFMKHNFFNFFACRMILFITYGNSILAANVIFMRLWLFVWIKIIYSINTAKYG